MKFKQRITYSFIISTTALLISFLFPFVPCRKAPNVPNPIYKWTLCTLNYDTIINSNSIVEYFGYTIKLNNAVYILTILIFILTYLILTIFGKFSKKKK